MRKHCDMLSGCRYVSGHKVKRAEGLAEGETHRWLMINGLRLLQTRLGDLNGPARKPAHPKSACQSGLGQYAAIVMKPHCAPGTAWLGVTVEHRLEMVLGLSMLASIMIRTSQ